MITESLRSLYLTVNKVMTYEMQNSVYVIAEYSHSI